MAPPPEAAGPTSFTCHRCGACCTGLRQRSAGQSFAEVAEGVYRLPTQGGLRVFAWEAGPFPADGLTPALAVADAKREELVVLAYELEADTCPSFDVEQTACEIYEDRPLVCRAFPLVVEPGEEGLEVAASSVCGARVPLADVDGEDRTRALARAYPSAFAPALAIPELVTWMLRLVAFLGGLDLLEPRGDLSLAELRAVDDRICLTDRVADAGVFTEGELRKQARRVVDRVRERAAGSGPGQG